MRATRENAFLKMPTSQDGLMLAQAIVEFPVQSKGIHNKSVLLSLP